MKRCWIVLVVEGEMVLIAVLSAGAAQKQNKEVIIQNEAPYRAAAHLYRQIASRTLPGVQYSTVQYSTDSIQNITWW